MLDEDEPRDLVNQLYGSIKSRGVLYSSCNPSPPSFLISGSTELGISLSYIPRLSACVPWIMYFLSGYHICEHRYFNLGLHDPPRNYIRASLNTPRSRLTSEIAATSRRTRAGSLNMKENPVRYC